MGIPAFYRWLVERYPLAVVNVIEETPVVIDGVAVPIDTARPNPNGVEFDNLYLDMNGIVHPCFHPEGLPTPKTYEEVFRAIFKYIDRIFSVIRPRKLLYMAIDGVAPRAKMNQQRTRRFRAAKDALDSASEMERARGLHEVEGEEFSLLEQTKKLDSNVITPGTEFMALLSSALRYYVHLRMNVDSGWQGIKVILSDAGVPGEGEHKIISYIRLQRNLPGFDPNTRHCLYGLDADLIMLALATHEIHFSILREDARKAPTNFRSANHGKDYLQRRKLRQGTSSDMNVDYISRQKFQFLNIWVLRDYLANDLRLPGLKADLERLIDDFIFMCIFIGNDFLPHVPSLEVSEGAINLLMAVYKKEFVRIGGYLTNSFEVNLDRLERFVQAVGSHENAIFRKRSQVQKERDFRFRGVSAKSSFKRALSSFKPVPEDANSVVDKVKLGEEGWKERFYAEKFEVKTDDDREKVRRHAVLKYIEGISWVMHYYYHGVCSWQWFYPYHYAPFASDFYGLDQLEIHFTLGKPFKPFDQLMGVLPAASAHALPLHYRKLMTDNSSSIFEFYPKDFELDMNGKRFAWQAICKLPFICESRLLSEIAKVEHTLTDEEKQRNSLGLDVLFIHISHPLAVKIFCFRNRKDGHPKLCKAKVKRKINPNVSGGMNGYIYISDKPLCPVEICSPIDGMEMLTKNEVMSVFYKYPSFHSHIPQPPKGVIMPMKSANKQDILHPPVLWHERSAIFGRRYTERPIPRSISGPRLERFSHGLVSRHYLAKQQESRKLMKTQNHVVGDGLACRSNSKPTDFVMQVHGGSDSHILSKSREGNLRRKICKQEACMEVLACQSNLKAGQKESIGCKAVVDCTVVDNLACHSKSKANSSSCNEIEMAKQRQNMGHLEVLDHAGADDLASKSNSKRTDCKVDQVGVDDLAFRLNSKPTDCVTQLNSSSGGYIVNEPSKGKLRKRKTWSKVSSGGELEKQQESTGYMEVADCLQKSMGCAEVVDCGADGSSPKLKRDSHDTIEVAKQQESLGFMEVVEPVRTDDLAFRLNLKPTDCVMQGNRGSQGCIISEPKSGKLRKEKRSKGRGGSHNNINVQKQPSTGCMEVVDSIGVHDLASRSDLKVISGSYDGLEVAKQQQSMKNIEVVEHVGVDDFASNLKPTDGVMQVNRGCESCITSEPKKKKPRKKKRAKKVKRDQCNKIEASKQQESMGLLEGVDPASLDCSTLQSKPKQADVHDLASRSDLKVICGSYDGLEVAKQQQSMKNIEVVEHVSVYDFASNVKPTDCVMQVNRGCDSCITSEPKKKKPRKKKRAKKGKRDQCNKIEASKQQESMRLLEGLDPLSLDCLTHQSKPKQADGVIEVNRGSEISIDGERRKRKQSNEHGGSDKEIKRQKSCDEK